MFKQNILNAEVTIKGVRPMLINHFNFEILSPEKKEKTGVAGNDPMEWKRSVLKTMDNQLYLEPQCVFACLRDGGKLIREGRGSIQGKLVATLQVLGDKILLTNRYLPENFTNTTADDPVYLDCRAVKNPSTKGRNLRYRVAANTGWLITFNIIWDVTIVSRTQMQSLIIDAGKFVGIGDGRNIGFGKFDLVNINMVEYA